MKTVLLVEDDEAMRDMERENLSFDGWSVTEAPNMATALNELRLRKFDLVCLDLKLPDSHAASTISAMAGIRAIAHPTKLMVITGQPVATLDLPCDAVLQKPFTGRDFSEAVKAATKSRQGTCLLKMCIAAVQQQFHEQTV